jgi:hypothetical protein
MNHHPLGACSEPDCESPVFMSTLCEVDLRKHETDGTIWRYPKPTRRERFWSKVVIPADKADCWIWTGARHLANYGQFKLEGKNTRAHRYAYEDLVGPIPEGLEIDHTCHTVECEVVPCPHRGCQNPAHLEPVTHTENVRRGRAEGRNHNAAKTHCKRGHEFDEGNTMVQTNGSRKCRTCSTAQQRKRKTGRYDVDSVHHRDKTHCPQGHEYSEENTYSNPNTGGRQCKTCNRLRARNML